MENQNMDDSMDPEILAEMEKLSKINNKFDALNLKNKKKLAFFNALPVNSLARKILIQHYDDREEFIYDFINAGTIAGAFDKNIMKNAYTIGHLLLKSKREKEMHLRELERRRTINSHLTKYERHFFINSLVFGYSDSRKEKALTKFFQYRIKEYLKSDNITESFADEGLSLKYISRFYSKFHTKRK